MLTFLLCVIIPGMLNPSEPGSEQLAFYHRSPELHEYMTGKLGGFTLWGNLPLFYVSKSVSFCSGGRRLGIEGTYRQTQVAHGPPGRPTAVALYTHSETFPAKLVFIKSSLPAYNPALAFLPRDLAIYFPS